MVHTGFMCLEIRSYYGCHVVNLPCNVNINANINIHIYNKFNYKGNYYMFQPSSMAMFRENVPHNCCI